LYWCAAGVYLIQAWRLTAGGEVAEPGQPDD
jgi:hypothetical protein